MTWVGSGSESRLSPFTPTAAIGAAFTLSAAKPVWLVTPVPGTDRHAGFVDQVQVLREVPAHTAYGPNGAAALALISQVDELTFPESYALGEVYEKVNRDGDSGIAAEGNNTDPLPGTLGAAYDFVDVFARRVLKQSASNGAGGLASRAIKRGGQARLRRRACGNARAKAGTPGSAPPDPARTR